MQTFTLDGAIEPKDIDGKLLTTRKHDSVPGAYTYVFELKTGIVKLTALKGKLQEVTYELAGFFPWSKNRMRKELLQAYGVDEAWAQVFENKRGSLVHDPQELYYATWDRKGTYVSFGVQFFREEIQRVVC
jgi:hypothetical protein